MKTNIRLYSYTSQFLEWEMFPIKVLGKIKIHVLCAIIFFFENRAVCEIMWTNIVQARRHKMTILHICIACWMPTATDTHSEYVIRTRLYVTFYVHCLACQFFVYKLRNVHKAFLFFNYGGIKKKQRIIYAYWTQNVFFAPATFAPVNTKWTQLKTLTKIRHNFSYICPVSNSTQISLAVLALFYERTDGRTTQSSLALCMDSNANKNKLNPSFDTSIL